MPHGKHGKYLLLIMFTILHIFACSLDIAVAFDDAGKTAVYYIRLDQKSRNGIYETDSMTMVPADEDYRRLSFRKIIIKGQINSASKTDPLTAAKHDVLERLLLKEGIKSIRNKSERDMDNTYEESVISFEGYFRTPYKILAQGYSKDGAVFNIDMEVDFAPMSYPPEWSFRYVRKKLNDSVAYILSLFH
ncbi:MAG: hypothetical protein WC799_03245 [Desulfobacteraceae bacterium]|jgi:hypothetical protein